MIDDADIVAELRYHGSDMGEDAAKEIESLRGKLAASKETNANNVANWQLRCEAAEALLREAVAYSDPLRANMVWKRHSSAGGIVLADYVAVTMPVDWITRAKEVCGE